jgi:hypothetical protein
MFSIFNIINLSGIARIYKFKLANVNNSNYSLLGRLDAVYPSQTGGYSKKNLVLNENR